MAKKYYIIIETGQLYPEVWNPEAKDGGLYTEVPRCSLILEEFVIADDSKTAMFKAEAAVRQYFDEVEIPLGYISVVEGAEYNLDN